VNNKLVAVLFLAAAYWINTSGSGGGILPIGDDSPVPGTGFHVLIVEDRPNRQKLPPEKFDAIMSIEIDDIIKKAGGRKYLYDQSQDVSNKKDPWITAAMKVPRKSLPWAVIDNDGRGTSAAVEGKAEFQKLVQEYAK